MNFSDLKAATDMANAYVAATESIAFVESSDKTEWRVVVSIEEPTLYLPTTVLLGALQQHQSDLLKQLERLGVYPDPTAAKAEEVQ